jgi:glycogen operon protein
MRFDPAKVLLDPYGRGVVVPENYSRDAARQAGDNAATAMKSVVVDGHTYDWEDDTPLQRPSSRTIVYEVHVRGFTCHPSSGVAERSHGTFAGLIEKIPYLQQLRITALELLPVFHFDAQDAPGKVNHWGYAPVFILCAAPGIQLRAGPTRAIGRAFATWLSALHRAGIELSSTLCSNHTAEGESDDPEFSRSGQHHLLHSRTKSLALRQLQRHGKHTQCESSYRPPDDSGQPSLLGQRDACRRLPIRFGSDS